MKKKIDIVFAMAGDIRRNSRALRQLRLMSEMGYNTIAFGIGKEEANIRFGRSLTVKIYKRPARNGPRFFWELYRLMSRAVSKIPSRLYHASDLYTLPALHGASRAHNAKLVYDARELYPYVSSTAGRPWVRWFWYFVEHRFVPVADAIFTVSPSIASHMTSSHNIDRPFVLYNMPEFREVNPTTWLQERLNLPLDTKIILHQGNIQKDRGCLKLIEAMDTVRGAVLVFLGGGPMRGEMQHIVAGRRLGNCIFFLPPVDPDMLLEFTSSAYLGVTLLEDTCLNHRYALPNKLFEYLMAGIPVVASNLPEISSVIDKFDVGALVDPSNPVAIAEALQRLVDKPDLVKRMSTNIPAALETFSWEKASQDFKNVYTNLLAGGIT